jgi:hypothetical protein
VQIKRHLAVQCIFQVLAIEQSVQVYHAVLAVVVQVGIEGVVQSIVQSVEVFLILALNHALKAKRFLTGTALLFQMDLANQKILSLFGFSHLVI